MILTNEALRFYLTQQSKKIHKKLEATGQTLYANMNELIGKKTFSELVTDMRTTREQL